MLTLCIDVVSLRSTRTTVNKWLAYPPKSNLRSSADSGCKICSIIYRTVNRTLKDNEPLTFYSFPRWSNASRNVCVDTDSLPNHLWGYSIRGGHEYILLHLRLVKSEGTFSSFFCPKLNAWY